MSLFSAAPHVALLKLMDDPDGKHRQEIYEAFVEEGFKVCERQRQEWRANGYESHELEPVVIFIRDVLEKSGLLE